MRRVILAILGTAVGLVALLSFKSHTSAAVATPPAAIGNQTGQATEPAATPSASSPGSGPTSSASSGDTTVTKTLTGDAADTRYGPVQVQITVKNGKIAAAQAVEYPQDNPRDEQINSYAVPVLNKETVATGSASIDAVSGATYTSNGYMTSLQSALDKARALSRTDSWFPFTGRGRPWTAVDGGGSSPWANARRRMLHGSVLKLTSCAAAIANAVPSITTLAVICARRYVVLS